MDKDQILAIAAAKGGVKPEVIRPYLENWNWDVAEALEDYNSAHGIVRTVSKAGVIRNARGELVAIYDEGTKELLFSNDYRTIKSVIDISHALDIIADNGIH